VYRFITIAGTGVNIRTYSVVLVLAAIAGTAIALPRLRRLPGVDRATLGRLIAWCTVGAWLGGRIHHLSNLGRFGWDRIVHEGRWWELFAPSFHAGGAILGLVVAAMLVTARRRVPLGRFGDAIVPGVGIGLAIGRFACFLNGCCTGTLCPHFWGVAFPKPTYVWNYHVADRLVPPNAEWSLPVHPLQLYFTAVGLLIAAAGWTLDRHKRYEGQSALVALLLFAGFNVLLEPFRGWAPARRTWMGVPQLTWVAGATFVATLLVLLYCEWRRRGVVIAPRSAGVTT
jgi:phosphatidylglycerol:prolipoprotein diacylglycerol transferase